MLRVLQDILAKFDRYKYRRHVERALALFRRGEVRRDGLQLTSMCSTLEIEWRARDIHPWDRDSPVNDRKALGVGQTLADTEAAITRLFAMLPHVDVLQVRVLGIESDKPILGGTAHRSSLADIPAGLSIGMKLRQLGITYHSGGSQFELLDSQGAVYERPWTEPAPALVAYYRNRKT